MTAQFNLGRGNIIIAFYHEAQIEDFLTKWIGVRKGTSVVAAELDQEKQEL